jgi:hypothetical protein
MKKIFILMAITALCSCGQPGRPKGNETKLFDNNTELKTFAVNSGWGYTIIVNGRKFIRQETIPVIQGSRPFTTKEQAEKVGTWVATRIRHNEEFSLTMPVLQSLLGAENAW